MCFGFESLRLHHCHCMRSVSTVPASSEVACGTAPAAEQARTPEELQERPARRFGSLVPLSARHAYASLADARSSFGDNGWGGDGAPQLLISAWSSLRSTISSRPHTAFNARGPLIAAISEFPKGRKYLISLSFRGKASVRPAQVGGFDVNIVIHGSTAVRGRGDLVAYRWALWKLIGIGGHLAVPPLPHHRAYGSVPRRFGRLSGQDRSRYGNPSESK